MIVYHAIETGMLLAQNIRIAVQRIITPSFICFLFLIMLSGNTGALGNSIVSGDSIPRGMTFLSSSLGRDVSYEEVKSFVKVCRINFVVIDFAWITYHWPNTDVPAVERLAGDLRKSNVTVAAMYRPRLLSPKEADIHLAKDRNGVMADDHNRLCFAYEDSVEWGVAWGGRILKACPSIDRLILYNVDTLCQCEKCAQGRGAKYGMDFVRKCCQEWRKIRPGIQIGHVGITNEYVDDVDFLCPFFCLNSEKANVPVNTGILTAQMKAIQGNLGNKPMIPLIKVCWETETCNNNEDIIHAVEDCQKSGIGFLLWEYEWIFHSEDGRYDPQPIVITLGGRWDQINRFYKKPVLSNQADQKSDLLDNVPLTPISAEETLGQKKVAIVLVKDFMRIENVGPDAKAVEFERYFPAVDIEQVVLGRWVSARTDNGKYIPIALAKVVPDKEGNLIHTWRLESFPAKSQVLVTVSSLVARRERVFPSPPQVIPVPKEYPPDVQPYLAATAMVARDHPEIRAIAEELLSSTKDPCLLARRLAEKMKRKSYESKIPFYSYLQNLPTAVSIQRYGGSCCASAVSAVAILRACGIPAQLTYCPGGYIHGITRFYVSGYGWVRMDSTCGAGKIPLVQERSDLGLVRLFDMPLEMETVAWNYAWPYYHNDSRGDYGFWSGGKKLSSIRFCHKPHRKDNPAPGYVENPFPHYESGNWSLVLGGESFEREWKSWNYLMAISRKAVMGGSQGEFTNISCLLPDIRQYVDFTISVSSLEKDAKSRMD